MDPATGAPWCPDCARSIHVARRVVGELRGTLIEVDVGTRSEWRDRENPVRVGDLKLTGIPAFAFLDKNMEVVDVVKKPLEKAASEKEAEDIIRDFVKKNVLS